MALEGSGRLFRSESYRTFVRISQAVANDSQFPFNGGDRLVVRIKGQRLIIEKAPDRSASGATRKAREAREPEPTEPRRVKRQR